MTAPERQWLENGLCSVWRTTEVARGTERKEQRRRDSGCKGPAAQAAGPIDDDWKRSGRGGPHEATQCECESRADWNLSVRSFSRQRWVTFASAGEISPMVPVRYRRVVLEDRAQRLDHVVGLKCPPADDHFVQRCPEAENVAPVIYRFPADLLGRHVASGPDDQRLGLS